MFSSVIQMQHTAAGKKELFVCGVGIAAWKFTALPQHCTGDSSALPMISAPTLGAQGVANPATGLVSRSAALGLHLYTQIWLCDCCTGV
jgi:hypothetical protein